jgi:hypothetical protein
MTACIQHFSPWYLFIFRTSIISLGAYPRSVTVTVNVKKMRSQVRYQKFGVLMGIARRKDTFCYSARCKSAIVMRRDCDDSAQGVFDVIEDRNTGLCE